MPLKSGYGGETIAHNVGEMERSGHSRGQAVAAAFAHARVSFFRKFPHGALPSFLAYPSGYRLRRHYDRSGKPLKVNFAKYRENPAPRAEIQKAAKLFEDFTGRAPDGVQKINLPEMPKAGLVFGQLIRVGYRSARDGLLYEHTFRKLKSRPLLIASSDGKTVLIVGGRYAFTDRGIEDR